MTLRGREVAVTVAALIAAIGLSLVLAGAVLALAGAPATDVLRRAVDYGLQPATLIAVLNKAIPYYVAGIAAAIGFHLGLFNIGIDGQYRLGAFAAAVVGGSVALPAAIELPVLVLLAMVVGAGWASIAGWLHVRRGVNVVISTIMLNAIATGIVAYLLAPGRLGTLATGSNNVTTSALSATAWIPSIRTPAGDVNGLVIGAGLIGAAYGFVLSRTTVGFEIRALGLGFRAAVVAGMRAPRLSLGVMAASGAVAGIVGLPELLGESHHFGLEFPAGLAFTGLSVAILGRNHPLGVAVAAFAWAWIERSAQVLDLMGVSREIVTVLQAVTVLSIVVADELTDRWRSRDRRRRVAVPADRPIADAAA